MASPHTDLQKLADLLDRAGLSFPVADRNGVVREQKASALLTEIIQGGGGSGGLDWQESVKRMDLSTPPGSPAQGDRYVVASPGSGAWAGHVDAVATWNGTEWEFVTPTNGTATLNEQTGKLSIYTGTAWVEFGITVSHSALLNLNANDHAQYQTRTGQHFNEVPTGVIDGSNAAFTLAASPNPGGSLMLFKNGLLMRVGVGNDYQLSGAAVTFESGQIPQTGDNLLASYVTL